MTEASYQLNLERGVTGPNTPTCDVAAPDRVSKFGSVTTQQYEQRIYWMNYMDEVGVSLYGDLPEEMYEQIFKLEQEVMKSLGIHYERRIKLKRIDETEKLNSFLKKTLLGGFRVLIYLEWESEAGQDHHTIGVLPSEYEDYYFVRSSGTGLDNDDIDEDVEYAHHIDDIAQWLHAPSSWRVKETNSRRIYHHPNIVILPPETRHPTHPARRERK